MKHTLITIIIALFTCTGGYYVGKNDLLSKLSLPTVESSAESDHRYSAKTIIQINPYGKKTSALGPSSQQSGMITRQFFQTQFAVIRSEDTINKAINDYRLDELFETDKTSLLESIKINLEASQERGTDLIVVKASSDTEEKAKKICYVIVKSYDQRRRDKINETRNEVISQYKEKIQAQEDNVEDYRAKLYKLSKSLGIPYHRKNTKLLLKYDEETTPKLLDAEDQTRFGKVRDKYEREFLVLQSIKQAVFQETIISELEIDPIQFHKYTLTPEAMEQMEARKQK